MEILHICTVQRNPHEFEYAANLLDEMLLAANEQLAAMGWDIDMWVHHRFGLTKQTLGDTNITIPAFTVSLMNKERQVYVFDYQFYVTGPAASGGMSDEYIERVTNLLSSMAINQINLSGVANLVSSSVGANVVYYTAIKESEDDKKTIYS